MVRICVQFHQFCCCCCCCSSYKWNRIVLEMTCVHW